MVLRYDAFVRTHRKNHKEVLNISSSYLKSYVQAIDEQLDMVTPALAELQFQHSVTPMIGLTFAMIYSFVMVVAYFI